MHSGCRCRSGQPAASHLRSGCGDRVAGRTASPRPAGDLRRRLRGRGGIWFRIFAGPSGAFAAWVYSRPAAFDIAISFPG